MSTKTRKMWAVFTNTDLTEGRGQQYAAWFTELEATAKRIAKGKYVQGTDAIYKEVEIILHNHSWYGPIGEIVEPSYEDRAAEKRLVEEREQKARKAASIEKAKALGLGEEDLKVLAG